MTDRFRNMHGQRLKAVFRREPTNFVTLAALTKIQNLGVDPEILFKKVLESNGNVSFDIYDHIYDHVRMIIIYILKWHQYDIQVHICE